MFKPSMMNTCAWLALAAGLLMTGCGSGAPDKEQIALEKMANRKPPGFIRLGNLTSDQVQFNLDGKPQVLNTDSGQASGFMPVGPGKHAVHVLKDKKEILLQSVDVASQGSTTLVLTESDKKYTAFPIADEPRNRKEGVVQAIAVALPSLGQASVSAGEVKVNLTSGSPQPLDGVKPGDTKISVTTPAGSDTQSTSLLAKQCYTIVAYSLKGKPSSVVFKNSGDDPAIAGAAGGG
jgi:hypothetical protein